MTLSTQVIIITKVTTRTTMLMTFDNAVQAINRISLKRVAENTIRRFDVNFSSPAVNEHIHTEKQVGTCYKQQAVLEWLAITMWLAIIML